MEFLKKNYEKVLLAVVLFGLVGALVFLVITIPVKRADLAQKGEELSRPRVKPLAAPDLTAENTALQRAQSPDQLDFTTKHKLLNPVLWQILPAGRLRKIDSDNQFGPGALQVTAIDPLYLRVQYGEPSSDGYLIHIIRETATRPADRDKSTIVSISSPNPNDPVELKSVTGPPDNPPELHMEFKNTHEAFTVAPDKPFEKVDGYTVSLRYPPDNQTVGEKLRVNDRISFEGSSYIVFAIARDSVVVLSRANNKKTTIPFNSTTAPR